MMLLREVRLSDAEDLEHFTKLATEEHPGFLNMAADRDQWKEKIKLSMDSFSEKIPNKFEAKYIFICEDLEKKKIVGISMMTAQHGTPEIPHFYFELTQEQKYSETINTGFIHGILKLKNDMNGPTEIGGLLVHPEYRGHAERVGRQISFIRFMYLGLHKSKFKRRVLAELLPPLTKKRKSALWEAIGRRFTNLEYPEADDLSGKNKEFILSLFPTDKIYTTFLPADARNAIGKVSKDTEAVLHMLKKIGFQYKNHVDPFDGGPHLIANADEIVPIQKLKNYVFKGAAKKEAAETGLLSLKDPKPFRAVAANVFTHSDELFCDETIANSLGIKIGDPVHFMPYY